MANSKYTQRHYIDMAGILAGARAASGGDPSIDYIENAMVALFAGDNDRFKDKLFRHAARNPSPVPATVSGSATQVNVGGDNFGRITF